MKKIKKLLAMLMAMTMVLGMSATVFATGTTPPNPEKIVNENPAKGTSEDKGTITVKGIEADADVYAFQIVEAVYGTDGKFTSKYHSLYTDILNAEKTNVDLTSLAEKLGTIKSGLIHSNNSWIYKETATSEGKSVTPTKTGKAGSDGTFTATEVPVGSYLILVEGADTHTYAPIIVSVSYVVNNGTSQVEGSALTISSDVAWAKVIDKPTIDKTANTGNTGDTNSANVGDLVTYTVTVSPIPAYDGAHPRFNVVDTLSSGLAFATKEDAEKAGIDVTDVSEQKDLVKVYTKTAEGQRVLLSKENYDASINGQGLKVDFVLASGGTKQNGYMLFDKAGETLIIEYYAKVTTAAVMNSGDNTNTAKLNYSKDSNIESSDSTDPDVPNKTTHTYTFDLSGMAEGSTNKSIVNKVGEEVDANNNKLPLPNAVFTLYKDNAGNKGDVYTNLHMPNGTVTSGTNGELIIKGLAAGTYYLQESSAPTGYSLNTDVYKIVITAHYKDGTDELEKWDVVVTNTRTNKPEDGVSIIGIQAGNKTEITSKLDIPNTKLTSLPSTGGIGTTIFTIGGCALMIIAAGLYFATRRKTAK